MQFSLNPLFIEYNFYGTEMRYIIEPREKRYVKGYRFLSFARTLGTHATKVAKSN